MRKPTAVIVPLTGLALLGMLVGSVGPTAPEQLCSSPPRVGVAPVSRSLGDDWSPPERTVAGPPRPIARELSLLSQLEPDAPDAGRRAALRALLALDQRRPLCPAAMNLLARKTAHSADPQQRAVALLIVHRRREATIRDAALLSTLQRDRSALVRRTAAWGLGHLGRASLTPSQQEELLARLAKEPDTEVSRALIDILLRRGVARPEQARRDLLRLMLSADHGPLREKLRAAVDQLRSDRAGRPRPLTELQPTGTAG